MHTSFFSDIIARKPALFRAMLAFNGRLGSVVPDCPEAWRVPGFEHGDCGGGALAAWLARIGVACRAAGRRVLGFHRRVTAFGLPECGRVGASGQSVRRVCPRCGAGSHYHPGSRSWPCVKALGEPLYRLWHPARAVSARQCAAVFSEPRTSRGAVAWQAYAAPRARLAIAICRAPWPAALKERVAENIEDAPPSVSPAVQRAVWFGLKKLLLKEVAPQWAPCFD
mgnify:CR=1 FL=1